MEVKAFEESNSQAAFQCPVNTLQVDSNIPYEVNSVSVSKVWNIQILFWRNSIFNPS